jgi:hypothetical protein
MSQIYSSNLLFDELTVSVTPSSEKTGFPVENVNDYQRRSRVWRSDGCWEITALNNKLVFENAASTPLTATIAVATYSSTASFLSAIQAALTTAGASTYTVTLDSSTQRIKIARTSGSHFSLLTTDAQFTAASILGFSTSVDRTGSLSYVADQLKIATSESIVLDLGTSRNPQAFLAVGERNADVKLSPTATIVLEANILNEWSAPLFSQTITYNRHMLALMDEAGLCGTDSYRYWRLRIVDPGNIQGYVELGCVYLGEMWTAERGAVKFPYIDRVKDLSDVAFSESGHAVVYRRQKTTTLEVNWGFLTTQDVEDLSDIWGQTGTTEPFFINLDPGEVFSIDRFRHFRMVRFATEPRFTLTHPGVWECDMSLREEL